VLKELHDMAVEDEVQRILLLEHLRQEDRGGYLAAGDLCTAHAAPCAAAAVAALQFRSRSNEIRAFARDQHDFVIAG